MFCNMYYAYESLSKGMKKFLRSSKAYHSALPLAQRNNSGGEYSLGNKITSLPEPTLHPCVRIHPNTRKEALFVNDYFTQNFEDFTLEESAHIRSFLMKNATQEHNIYRHKWRKGDLIVWDNACTMHYAFYDYKGHARLLYRTTAKGDVPQGPSNEL